MKTLKQLALTEKSKKLQWPESTIEVFEQLKSEIEELSLKLIRFTKYFINGVEEMPTVGGNACEEFSLPWVKATYHVIAQLKSKGTSPVSIVSAHCELGKVVVEFSDDPDDDHVVTLIII